MRDWASRAPGRLARVCLAVLALVCATAPAYAASDDQAPAPDFFLGRPRASIGVGGSWLFARAGSDLFNFVTDQLTIDRAAFNVPAVAGELGISLTPRLDVVVGMEFSRSSTPSEYRRFTDNRNLPIEQETSLRQFNATGSLKIALVPHGRSISRFAWIPRTVTPFVGAGGGLLHYQFKQTGDFVDYVDLSVFTGSFVSKGWTPSAHAFGGADVQIYRRLFLTVEGRYVWASAKLEKDFVAFDPIDLAGFRAGAGVHVVF